MDVFNAELPIGKSADVFGETPPPNANECQLGLLLIHIGPYQTSL